MSDTMFVEKCLTYIDCHLQQPRPGGRVKRDQRPAVTISRLAGAGGITVARKLADWLQARAPKGPAPWTVFHKNLVQKVLEEHNLPSRLAQFMPEDKISGIQDAMEELLGLHPPTYTLLHQTTETILHLAELGNVIMVGRGATAITAHCDHVVHVRLVGSLERRVERVMEFHNINRKAAYQFIKKEDAARTRYLRRNFGCDIADPTLYHLVINTDRVTFDEAVELIGQMVLKRYD